MADETPPPITGVVPHLFIKDGRAGEAIDFYKVAFGAEELQRMPAQNPEKLMHAALKINGDHVFLCDDFPEMGHPSRPIGGFNLHLQVDDAQAWQDRAAAAGATVVMPVAEQFWGDIYGQIRDPYGVDWSIGQSKR